MEYFRSQIIPGNPGTMVYWSEEGEHAKDIPPECIPVGAVVNDVTFDYDVRKIRKTETGWELA